MDKMANIMIFWYVQHRSCLRRQFVEHFRRIAHNRSSKSVRIAEEFKICRGNNADHLAVLGPLPCTALMGDKEMGCAAKEKIILSDRLFGLFHLAVVEIAEAVGVDMPFRIGVHFGIGRAPDFPHTVFIVNDGVFHIAGISPRGYGGHSGQHTGYDFRINIFIQESAAGVPVHNKPLQFCSRGQRREDICHGSGLYS